MTDRQRRIAQIYKLEAKQKKNWHVGVQRRIDRLRVLVNWVPEYDDEIASGEGGFYVAPEKRSAGEYAAYLGSQTRGVV